MKPIYEPKGKAKEYKAWVVCWYNDYEEPCLTVFNNKEVADRCVMYNINEYDHVFCEECPVYGKYLIGDEIHA